MKKSYFKKIVFLGPPGSGKGTQALTMAKKFGLGHLSSGDLFRSLIKNKNSEGKVLEGYLKKGLLVPDEVTLKIIGGWLNKPVHQKQGFILDGFPRTLAQARSLDKIVDLEKVFYFKISQPEVIRRLSARRTCGQCGAVYSSLDSFPKKEGVCDKCKGKLIQRPDDSPAVIKKRFLEYTKKTRPLIDYYKKKKILEQINARSSRGEIAVRLNQKISK